MSTQSTEHEDKIRARAHEIWERDGCPDGKHLDHWHQAEQEIAKEQPLPATLKPPIVAAVRVKTAAED